jgi:aryl-alcohol dehydrogenase-like predicted oxidoreductase
MYSGLLTGKMTHERVAAFAADDWRKRDEEFQEPRLSRNLALAEMLGQIGQQYGRSAADVAVAWTLRHGAVTGAIVGARNARQVDGFIHAADFRLSEADQARIEEFFEHRLASA